MIKDRFDPTAAANRFLLRFEEAYGTNRPQFYQGAYVSVRLPREMSNSTQPKWRLSSYESRNAHDPSLSLSLLFYKAIQQAKEEHRFLLVYLHSHEHQDSQLFCRLVDDDTS